MATSSRPCVSRLVLAAWVVLAVLVCAPAGTTASKDSKNAKDSKDSRDAKDAKDAKDSRDAKDAKDSMDAKDAKDSMDAKEPKHKTHNVTFFAHEAIETGDDATARIVAGPGGNTSVLQFGALLVVDDPLTKSADPASAAVGKLQGLYAVDGDTKYRLQVTVLIDQPGDDAETTYEIAGQRASFNESSDRQQLAVLAGTGSFLGQTGYALVSTVSQTLVGDMGAQYNVQKWTLVVGKYQQYIN